MSDFFTIAPRNPGDKEIRIEADGGYEIILPCDDVTEEEAADIAMLAQEIALLPALIRCVKEQRGRDYLLAKLQVIAHEHAKAIGGI